jgi:hypothetical protein
MPKFPFAAWMVPDDGRACPAPTMRRFALLLALAALPAALPAAPLGKDIRPVRLFNGTNFEGLHLFAEAGPGDATASWKVEDGMLRCVGTGKGYARTTHAHADYRLRLEWRWPARPGNSGVMVNITGPDVIWPKSVECQLANGRAGDFAFFSDARGREEIVSRNPSGVSTGRLARSATAGTVEKAAGEWNAYEIVVAGDTITVSVNGVQVNRMSGVVPSGGLIAFQAEGAPIDFRHIELTPLPAAKELNAPMPK